MYTLVFVIGGGELCSDYEYADLGMNECRRSAKKLKGFDNQTMEFRMDDSSESPPEYKDPKHCYVGDNIVFYNIDPNGKRRKVAAPVCTLHGNTHNPFLRILCY